MVIPRSSSAEQAREPSSFITAQHIGLRVMNYLMQPGDFFKISSFKSHVCTSKTVVRATVVSSLQRIGKLNCRQPTARPTHHEISKFEPWEPLLQGKGRHGNRLRQALLRDCKRQFAAVESKMSGHEWLQPATRTGLP